MNAEDARELAGRFVEFLETGAPPRGLFAEGVFADFTMPLWRLQAEGVAAVVALRRRGHPGPGQVPRWRCDPTPTGFVVEFEERWQEGGHEWTSRELARADVGEGGITFLSIYCTGDWDEGQRALHQREVKLLRP
jgi:hypothetical protein